ncbi:MAG TPA: ABC transporter permease [Bacillales bacterium]|nr:ABC transporter permease [Bacillales bacterium]
MKEMDQMWRERRADYWNEAVRYLRLIANSGFMFSLYVAFILAVYYYGTFINWLPAWFPADLVFALIATGLLVRSPVRTFLKEADLVFLLPFEMQMDKYFKRSLNYSFLLQSGTIIFVFFILSPLFFARVNPHPSYFLLTVAIILAAKYWNVKSSWCEMYLRSGQPLWMSILLRAMVTFVFTWLLFRGAPVYFVVIVAAIMIFLSFYYFRTFPEKHTLKWERLLHVESARLNAFYRMANLFTEVPRLKQRVKPRRWLSSAIGFPFDQGSVFTSFYFKTFVRANDFFGTYVRLLVVGVVVLLIIPHGWGQLVVFLLILYVSGLQLYTIWGYRTGGNWEQLLPISQSIRERSFLRIVFVLLLIQTVLFVTALTLSGLEIWKSALGLVLGAVLSGLFAFVYLQKKIKSA